MGEVAEGSEEGAGAEAGWAVGCWGGGWVEEVVEVAAGVDEGGVGLLVDGYVVGGMRMEGGCYCCG